MKRYCFIFLFAIITISVLQGSVYGNSLSLTANSIQMEKSTTYNININGKRPEYTYKWTSSNENVVNVNSGNGKINAVNEGEVTITCFITGINGEQIQRTCKVVVGFDGATPQLKKTKLELETGEQFDINIARKIEKSKYKWSSTNENVININVLNGLVTAISKGEAKAICTITAPEKFIVILLATIKVTEPATNIIWEDEFNSTILDSTKWSYEYGYVRNHELQKYTDSLDHVLLRDGYLVIKALKDKNGAWTSASVHTNNKLEIGNARIEARIKLPYESGAFPAFWMLGADYEVDYSRQRGLGDTWLEAREIDIMEGFGKVTKVQGGVFVKDSSSATVLSQYASKSQEIDITQFHTYAIEKSNDVIRFYCDDNLYYSHVITDAGLKDPFYILLNLAVGAAGGTPDPLISDMEMMVDYVRVTALPDFPVTDIESITLEIEEWRGKVGDTKKVNANLLPEVAQDRTITWISSDPSVATVQGGYVRLIKAGTSIISATTANGVTATCKVICN